jgi:hypothetical protein
LVTCQRTVACPETEVSRKMSSPWAATASRSAVSWSGEMPMLRKPEVEAARLV